jgi:peptidoglycan/xylan/chitin deacetylase (PgdA/CDA1 family)
VLRWRRYSLTVVVVFTRHTRLPVIVSLAMLIVMPAGCVSGRPPLVSPSAPVVSTTSVPVPPSTETTTVNPAAYSANELGLVPVLMYHRIVADPHSVYDRTPADFRAELVRLAKEHYVPITAAQYTAGDIDIPAGTHPVVLTFDDGDRSQFSLTPAGVPAATSAVGILLDVARQYQGFRPVATFYLNVNPFGDDGGTHTVPWLSAHGMDIGNHTLTHADLAKATNAGAQQEIAEGDQAIRTAAPDVQPVTIALPFGLHPQDAGLSLRGRVGRMRYRYRGAFLVGANPAPSPYSADFDPLRIPRIRSQADSGPDAQYCSTAWLNKLAATPGERYTSDGMPDRISFPRGTGQAAAAFRKRTLVY